jgi:hypothetical protein
MVVTVPVWGHIAGASIWVELEWWELGHCGGMFSRGDSEGQRWDGNNHGDRERGKGRGCSERLADFRALVVPTELSQQCFGGSGGNEGDASLLMQSYSSH